MKHFDSFPPIRNLPIRAVCLCLAASYLCFAMPATTADDDTQESRQPGIMQNALLAAARNALKLGDPGGAIVYYNRYLSQQPQDSDVALELAGVLTQANRSQEAVELCDKVLEASPGNPEAQKLKAIGLGRLNRIPEALRVIADLRARFPEDIELQKIEAGFRALDGDRHFSRDLFRELLDAGFNDPKDMQDYLDLLAADRQWETLLEAHETHRDRLPSNDNIRSAVLKAHLALRHDAEVTSFFSEIKDPSLRQEAAILISDQLAAAGRLEEAIAFLAPIVEQGEPNPDMTVKLALLEAYNKQPLFALRRINALPREMNTEKVRIARAKVFWASGRPEDALAELDNLGLPEANIEAALARAGLLYDLHREWEIPELLAKISFYLERGEPADRKLAWCLASLAHIRAGNIAAARPIIGKFKKNEPGDLAPDILLVMLEDAARNSDAWEAAVAKLGIRLRNYRPGDELIRPALLEETPSASWRIAMNTRPANHILLLEFAKAAIREGRIAEAEQAFDMAALQNETAFEARLGLAECALRRSDDAAFKRQAEILLDSEAPPRFLLEAAILMLKARQDGLAESFYSRTPDAAKEHPNALAIRAAWLIRAGRKREAIAIISRIQPSGPAETGILTYLLGRLAELATNDRDSVYKTASERLLALAKNERATGALDAALAAADAMIRVEEYDQARDLLKHAGPGPACDLRACARLMLVDIRMGKNTEAERCIRAILARRPGDAANRLLLARMGVWENNFPLAWRRYNELMADYPEDKRLHFEYEAKRNRALSRHRLSVPAYAACVELKPGDRETAAENGDAWFLRGFNRAAAQRYRPATWAFPDDHDLARSLTAAERLAHVGLAASADIHKRQGEDRKVDVEQSLFSAGILLPLPPDAFDLEAGAGLARFKFDDHEADTLNARRFYANARWEFTNGVEIVGAFEMLDHQTIDTAWRGNLDIGYKGLEGWKVAVIGGRQDMRENYYTIMDGMENYWIGLYAQWQPTERLRLFGQYRAIEIPAPTPGAMLSTNYYTGLATQTVGKVKVVTPVTIDGTWDKNHAYEGVAEVSYQLFFAPHSLRVWANVYRYETDDQNDFYWTPEDAFVAGQVGLHWRHSLGARSFTGSSLFYYGAYAAISRNTDSDTSPSVKGELGWSIGGWSFTAEAAKTWGDTYEEESVFARLSYRF